MPFGKIYSEWNIAKEGGQDLFVGFYRLLEENKTRTLKEGKDIAIIANGDTVRLAIEAAEKLEAEGIHVAEGETAQRTAATLIPWEQAAKRIRELLDLGRYMPQSELDRVDEYERQQRAAQLWYLRQDFAEGTADAGYLPTVNTIYGKNHGVPEESAAISDLLGHPEGLQNLRDELEQFVQAYAENRELLRFHFHRLYLFHYFRADLLLEYFHP